MGYIKDSDWQLAVAIISCALGIIGIAVTGKNEFTALAIIISIVIIGITWVRLIIRRKRRKKNIAPSHNYGDYYNQVYSQGHYDGYIKAYTRFIRTDSPFNWLFSFVLTLLGIIIGTTAGTNNVTAISIGALVGMSLAFWGRIAYYRYQHRPRKRTQRRR
jgi:4-hydroxybenzoate polyprenyltransferase